MTEPRSTLSTPETAAIAWARYRRMLRWVAVAAVVAISLAILYLWLQGGPFTIHMLIATIAGVGGTVMLGGALMLLVFLSSGTGHDEDAAHGGED